MDRSPQRPVRVQLEDAVTGPQAIRRVTRGAWSKLHAGRGAAKYAEVIAVAVEVLVNMAAHDEPDRARRRQCRPKCVPSRRPIASIHGLPMDTGG